MFECGDMNHWKRNCPKLKNKGQEQCESLSEEKGRVVVVGIERVVTKGRE